MRFKSWSYYNQWLDIFGKDRATGDQVMDHMNLVNDLLINTDEQEGDTADKDPPPVMKQEELEGDYMKSTDETFNNLASRMRTEYDTKVARSSLNDIIKGIPELSLQNKLNVVDEMVKNTSHMKYL